METFITGGLSGLLSDLVVHPIDTLRARIQVQGHSNQFHYRSSFHAFRSIIQQEGIKALYQGFRIVALGTVPGHAFYFTGYETAKKFFAYYNFKENTSWKYFLSGFFADLCGSLAWTPMDVIKQRLMIQQHNVKNAIHAYRSTIDALRQIYINDGILGLYHGYWAGILTYGPYVGLYFTIYEKFKYLLAKSTFFLPNHRSVTDFPFYSYLILSATASSISAICTCPLDVVKTRIQVQGLYRHAHLQRTNYRNIYHAFKCIITREGCPALFSGCVPRAIWISLGTAITMMFYEELRKYFKKT